jgi:hypothetical protein
MTSTPADEVIRYAAVLRALRQCFEAEKHDADAYVHFGEAMDVAMDGARRAAEDFVAWERRRRTKKPTTDALRATLCAPDSDWAREVPETTK